MFQLLSAPPADKFLSFKMDPLPIYTVHKQNKYQDFRQRLFTSKSNPAAPVSGENYLACTVLFIMQLVNTFIINTPDTTDGQLLILYYWKFSVCYRQKCVCYLFFHQVSCSVCYFVPFHYSIFSFHYLGSPRVQLCCTCFYLNKSFNQKINNNNFVEFHKFCRLLFQFLTISQGPSM